MSSPWALAFLSSFSGLLGVVIGHLLAGRSQHKQFLKDSMKDEFRSLLDVLGTSVRQIKELKSHVHVPSGPVFDVVELIAEQRRLLAESNSVNQQITSALLSASQALDDRLFINVVIVADGVKGDWKKIEELAHLPGAGQQSQQQATFNVVDFTQAWMELARKIRRIAAQEL